MAKLIMIVGASLLIAAAPVQAGPHDERVGALDTLWKDANGKCRGSMNPREIGRACRERDRLDRKLEARGYCLCRINYSDTWILGRPAASTGRCAVGVPGSTKEGPPCT